MGMFDKIKCEVLLPDGSMQNDREFQTKSLENLMNSYVITQNGELYEEDWDSEWVEDSSFKVLGGYLKRIEGSYHRKYLTDFHGDIIFYSGDILPDVSDSGEKTYRDYHARFTEGKLSRMWYKDHTY